MERIRPKASVGFDRGEDGRDCYHYVQYRCPKCDIRIIRGDVACAECGTFLDWSKKAKIVIVRQIEWE